MSEAYMLNEILDIIMKAVVTAFAGTFAGGVIVWIKGAFKKDRVYTGSLKALAHDSFHRQCRRLLVRDSITEDELENLNYLYESYKALGLNGTGEELYKRILEKPIV